MSNYLFYTLLGYAAGLVTSGYIDVIISRRVADKKKEEVGE